MPCRQHLVLFLFCPCVHWMPHLVLYPSYHNSKISLLKTGYIICIKAILIDENIELLIQHSPYKHAQEIYNLEKVKHLASWYVWINWIHLLELFVTSKGCIPKKLSTQNVTRLMRKRQLQWNITTATIDSNVLIVLSKTIHWKIIGLKIFLYNICYPQICDIRLHNSMSQLNFSTIIMKFNYVKTVDMN